MGCARETGLSASRREGAASRAPVCCASCYSRLKAANHEIASYPAVRKQVAEVIKKGASPELERTLQGAQDEPEGQQHQHVDVQSGQRVVTEPQGGQAAGGGDRGRAGVDGGLASRRPAASGVDL